jgi:hypothetical protein
LKPPPDVQVAIALSKSNFIQQQQQQQQYYQHSGNFQSPSGSISQPLSSDTTVKNTYSLGNSLPQGVTWRYVNVLPPSPQQQETSKK